MEIPTDFFTYAKWSGYLTLALLLITIIGFIFKWGLRFRLVGTTGFMGVLTFGIFTLGISLFNQTKIPGASRYSLVYDNGNDQTVITVPPKISESEVEATLLQAANNLYSYGRASAEGEQLTIRVRTMIHPQPGVSQPIYLGQIKRSLANREDKQMQAEIFSENFAQLSSQG